ncbi:MAG: hypothetical protein Q9217_006333 [Psora testacea]
MSLVSTNKTSDSGLIINLHPLVLLTVSDYITRHILREQTTPIVGALLGQQSGRSISLEHAFECLPIPSDDGSFILHEAWFKDRLQQYKDVHQAPALDLVGWFTTTPATGPEAIHVPLHQQILQNHNETAILLAFHPAKVLDGKSAAGKLPLTVYESVYDSGGDVDEDMDVGEKEPALELRFRELPYSIETGEAEMISVDFVARGGGNATAVNGSVKADKTPQASQTTVGQVDEKSATTAKDATALDDVNILSSEDEELIASLTARTSAIKMLHTRIKLLKSYLTSLPPSYLTASSVASNPVQTTNTARETSSSADVDYPLLRSTQALLSRLPLVLPAGNLSAYKQETLAEKSDVELVSLLGSLGQSVRHARELGRKFAVVENGKNSARKMDLRFGRLSDLGFEDGEGTAGPSHEGFLG